METPSGWFSITNGNILSIDLENSLGFFEHDRSVQKCVISTQDGVDGGFVDKDVEEVVWVLEIADIHDFVNHQFF